MMSPGTNTFEQYFLLLAVPHRGRRIADHRLEFRGRVVGPQFLERNARPRPEPPSRRSPRLPAGHRLRKESTPNATRRRTRGFLTLLKEAHQARLTPLSSNLVGATALSEPRLRLAQTVELRAKLLEDGLAIGARMFQQLNGALRSVPGRGATWVLNGARCLR